MNKTRKLVCQTAEGKMTEDYIRRAKIARIKRYKKMKRIESYRRKVQVNAAAAKMLAYAAIPALACTPAAASNGNDIGTGVPVISEKMPDGNIGNHVLSTLVDIYDIDTAIKEVVNEDNEEFVAGLNRQYDEIKNKGKQYARRLFGNINYCNMAVYRVLKETSPDYMDDFLNNMENPAACINLINHVKNNHPDCIRYEQSLSAEKINKGDIVIVKVARKNEEGAVTSTGNHTVTCEGDRFISFNSESKYNVRGRGYVISMNKIREKELSRKLASMDRTAAVSYLVGLSSRRQLAAEKTKVLTADKFASLQAYNMPGR